MAALRIFMDPPPETSGSICCLARDPTKPDALYIVSAAHVVTPLDLVDMARIEARIRTQRILCEFPGQPPRAIGRLVDWEPIDFGSVNRFDAGQVLVDPSEAQALLAAVPLPTGVTDLAEENWDVGTLGAKTQQPRNGAIIERRVADLAYMPVGCTRNASFNPDNHFATACITAEGDSGAPAFNPSGQLVGMLVAGNSSRSYFARAARVLKRFSLKPVTLADNPAGVSALSLWDNAPAAGAVKTLAAVPPAPAPDKSVDVLARTLWGEARGEGRAGIEGVASVVVNRASRGPKYWWGGTIVDVCKRPNQFSCWNPGDPNRARLTLVTADDAAFRTCAQVAQAAVEGTLADATLGATHYHTDAIMPPWARGKTPCARIGHHLFYNNVE
jgi:hypothetical protein